MSYFTAAVVRAVGGWSASEIALADAADVEDVADRLRDIDPDASVSLLFVESDDAYLAILRLDQGEDLRIFASDAGFAEESRLGALLLGDVAEPVIELDATEMSVDGGASGLEQRAGPADVDPVGDADLLVDLGVPATKLLELCAHDGMLPSDITAELCQAIGCGDEVEELREA